MADGDPKNNRRSSDRRSDAATDKTRLQQLAQLSLVNKLLEYAAWHDNVRANLAARIAVAEVAETSIRKSIEIRPLILWRFPNALLLR